MESENPSVKPYGIVVCGGKSSRMGTDKSQLVYHGIPQYQYVYHQLGFACERVFVSCNKDQVPEIGSGFELIIDHPELSDHGPIVAILTAFNTFPKKDLLIIGCDYPFLSSEDLTLFLGSFKRDSLAAAFYNNHGKYEPLLAWYSKKAAPLLQAFFTNKNYSLQHFLNEIGAEKYVPESENSMISVDTPEDFRKTLEMLSEQK